MSLPLEIFKAHQRLAYDSVVWARSQLQIGMSEIEAAELIKRYFSDRGYQNFFHLPFAWFGDRSGFAGFKRPQLPSRHQLLPHLGVEFLPSERKLEMNMAVTLDVAPSINGMAVDIGYSFTFGELAAVTKARQQLKILRSLILAAAQAHLPIGHIYQQVEERISEWGYRSCHGLYPLGVLGHRIGKLPNLNIPGLTVMGFSPSTYAYLAKEMLAGPTIMSAQEVRPLSPGLWAVEPHFGGDGFGVKFEEILVVTATSAFWLDDGLPHMTEV